MIEKHSKGYFFDESDPGEPYYSGSPRRLSVTVEEAGILALLATGKRVLEIGTGLGVSTRAMSETASSVVTIDVDEWVRSEVFPTLPSNVGKLSSSEHLGSPSPRFDMVFVDGDHRYESVVKDLELCRGNLVQGGLVILHDYGIIKEVKRAASDCGFVLVKLHDTLCSLAEGHFN